MTIYFTLSFASGIGIKYFSLREEMNNFETELLMTKALLQQKVSSEKSFIGDCLRVDPSVRSIQNISTFRSILRTTNFDDRNGESHLNLV